ncbi:hypothetical protein BC643_1819 [Mangrovibacterium diazotrophicum]|uniref:DUF4398 domain-containing protein n=2 Tax=Mangrovibacterium diazotrophicum TaxID=1261403 RepID=A0A419W7M3_9BACT|nr:hypothetical protein BC643_1819 [Mangrovibacterium diazotrophicum]
MIALTAVSIAVLFSSCGKIPQAEIDAANVAIEAAKTAGADVYVAEDFAALQDSMRAVNENVEAQNGKLFKNFDKVKEQLVVVTQLAADTKTKTEVRKEEVKQEVAALQTEIADLVAQNNELVAQAPKGKEGAAALEAIKGDIALIEASQTEVTDLVAADNLMGALEKSKASKEKAVAINTELSEVIAKYAKNKKR